MKFTTSAGPLSVNISDITQLIATVSERLAAGEGFAIATLNLDHLVKLRRDTAFAEAYLAHEFVTADGNPVVWCCHRAGQDVALAPGADAVMPLARIAGKVGVKVALLGSTEGTLEAAANNMRSAAPDLDVAVLIAPPMGYDPTGSEAAAHLAQLEDQGIGICFLALGAPKQEILAARGRSLAPSVGFVSIGAGLDFIAGTQVRAPRWVRSVALEWLWRLMSNPRRLAKRYLQSALILPGLWIEAGRQRKRNTV